MTILSKSARSALLAAVSVLCIAQLPATSVAASDASKELTSWAADLRAHGYTCSIEGTGEDTLRASTAKRKRIPMAVLQCITCKKLAGKDSKVSGIAAQARCEKI